MPGTIRLYLQDDHCVDATATVVAVRDAALAVDRTCFYPGGGGQPPDQGRIEPVGGPALEVVSVHAGDDDLVWHVCVPPPSPDIVGRPVRLAVDPVRRRALARYHTVLHVLNTIALRDYGAWITGVQIGVDYSRIDFKWDGFTTALSAELEDKVNAVLSASRPLRSYYISEDEFRRREDLLRTLEVRPPVVQGRVRVVEIEGFDAQACGGTHMPTTGDVGRFSIFRTENKGRINKRLYVRLDEPVPGAIPGGVGNLF
ncbi:alanyl-tRNA editing protein [Vineibacter terrae]|uniref:alanyl-tRNA editing protein n=1 Tax=Vineibacter terrae TaxID=2586908 RepID=UPI002E34F000|nr:alanyl-tRNA editing protein [Vineibacter terrae]HEX2890999.1 alanyl-tRNA editing protein [Vineibacter terrae]